MKALDTFIGLIWDQLEYGGRKYALDDKRESTDILFDVHGKNWLFGNIDKYCYDEETQILTNQGWKYFKDLDKTEKVATLNPKTNEIEYQKPIEYQKYKYNFKYLYYLKNTYTDLLVTPFHSMFYRYRDRNYILTDIERILHKTKSRIYLKLSANYEGKEQKYFILPSIVIGCGKGKYIKKSQKISMDLWLSFLGWYLSEGWYIKKINNGHYIIGICQSFLSNLQKYNKIIKLLNKFPFNFTKTEDGFRIYNKQLYLYLKQLGDIDQKYIPREFLTLSRRQLKILLDSLIGGDGHIKKYKDKKYLQYFTVSTNLANDFQELVFKLGYHSIFNRVKTKNYLGYNISFRKHDETLLKTIEKIKINKPTNVYDITVPKYHIIYVKRNGKPVWCGNCFRWNNLKREKDLLKIAAYQYILWLKRGFHIQDRGVNDSVDTNLKTKEENFNKFIELVTNYYNQYKSELRSLPNIYSPPDTARLKVISDILGTWSHSDWSFVKETHIAQIFCLAFEEWLVYFSKKKSHETDTWNEVKNGVKNT